MIYLMVFPKCFRVTTNVQKEGTCNEFRLFFQNLGTAARDHIISVRDQICTQGGFRAMSYSMEKWLDGVTCLILTCVEQKNITK